MKEVFIAVLNRMFLHCNMPSNGYMINLLEHFTGYKYTISQGNSTDTVKEYVFYNGVTPIMNLVFTIGPVSTVKANTIINIDVEEKKLKIAA